MRHQIPTILALTLVVSVSFLMGQLVVNKSQGIQADYAEASMYDAEAQSRAQMVQAQK